MIKSMKKLSPKDSRLAMAHMYVAFIALFIGATAGLLQTLERSGKFELPFGIGYYQILTAHGVTLGLVLTTFSILGFMLAGKSRTAGTYYDSERNMAWFGFSLIVIGTITATIFIILNKATVLCTIYAPLMAHSAYYIGVALVTVGSLLDGVTISRRHALSVKENLGEKSPRSSF